MDGHGRTWAGMDALGRSWTGFVSLRFIGLAVFLGIGRLWGAPLPQDTAEGMLLLPPGRAGVRQVAVSLPDKLRDTPVLLLDRQRERWPFILLDEEENLWLLYDARQNESFRLLYGFDLPVEGEIPVTLATNPRLLEGRVRVAPLRDQSMLQARALHEIRHPLTRLGVVLAVGICAFAALAIWYRRAVR